VTQPSTLSWKVTALIYAAYEGNVPITSMLIKAGADLNQQDPSVRIESTVPYNLCLLTDACNVCTLHPLSSDGRPS
jgi:ankyrin repeat protein